MQEVSQNLATVRVLLDLGARADVTTSAGTPLLVVAVTMLHVEVVSVLITAGANPSVNIDGIFHDRLNPATVSRFIPEALIGTDITLTGARRGSANERRRRLFTSETRRATGLTGMGRERARAPSP